MRFLPVFVFVLCTTNVSTARAASVLLVSDSGADTNIATALRADGHTVMVVMMDFSGGSNPTLRASLSGYDVVIWSATGSGYGDSHTDATVFTNLTSFVMGGGHVLVTGYDSIASPTDPMLISFLGGTGSIDVPGEPGPVAMVANALTEGVVDIRGMAVTGSYSDRDVLTGIGADTVAVVTTAGISTQPQWTLRTVGSGLIAYVSNGEPATGSHIGWTTTGSVFNGAVRNFVFAADRGLLGPCMGLAEGATCAPPTGPTGLCRGGRCCVGCWDGMRCRAGTSPMQCGAGGVACRACADTMFCTLDTCMAGTCSSVVSPLVCDDALSCTMDVCHESTDSCTHPPAASCTIGGECVGEGTTNPTYPCLVCDPLRSMTDWSTVATGTVCGAATCSGARLTTRACDDTGACRPTTTPCPAGGCADGTMCAASCTAGECAAGEFCSATTMRCEPLLANGDACTTSDECESGSCVDGVCCEAACDGTCERCVATTGVCTLVPIGIDPDDECLAECDGAGACAEPEPDGGMMITADDGGASSDAATPPPRDGGARVDSGTPPPPRDTGGCNCGAVGGHPPGAVALLLVGLVALLARRRR